MTSYEILDTAVDADRELPWWQRGSGAPGSAAVANLWLAAGRG